MRYNTTITNAVWWWVHDTLVHPATGTLGLAGRLLRSPRLMALAHHVHNATAPSNDAWADYAEAAKRAGANESGGPAVGDIVWSCPSPLCGRCHSSTAPFLYVADANGDPIVPPHNADNGNPCVMSEQPYVYLWRERGWEAAQAKIDARISAKAKLEKAETKTTDEEGGRHG